MHLTWGVLADRPALGFDLHTALVRVAGVFLGSSIWWLLLTTTVWFVSLAKHLDAAFAVEGGRAH
jgi:hypothetical protein